MATILHVIPFHFIPPESGGANNIAGLFDFLGKKHKVIVVSTPRNAVEHNYPITVLPVLSAGKLRYVNIFSVFTIMKICRREKVQYLIVEQPFIGLFVLIAARLLKIPFYIRNSNVEFERHRTIGKWWWWLLKIYEGYLMRKADGIFFITDYDLNLAVSTFHLSPSKCQLVPYGLYYAEVPKEDKDYRRLIAERHHLAADEKILLLFGVLSYYPNAEAVEIILDKINPLLLQQPGFKYKIIIAGKGLPDRLVQLVKEEAASTIEYIGFVDQIDEYIKGADVILNPVIRGGGIKTKVVEALGFDKNVVSSTSGAVGIDDSLCGGKLLVSADDDWQTFSGNIIRAASMQAHTPKSFFDFFYWGNIANSLDRFFS